MKVKIKLGADFGGLLTYLLTANKKGVSREHTATMLGGSAASPDLKSLAATYRSVAKLRPEVKRPVMHISLSLPEGERLSDGKWLEVARNFLILQLKKEGKGMSVDDLLYTVVRHTDTAHDHIHICLNRVALTGDLYQGKDAVYRAMATTTELEKHHRLTLTPEYNPSEPPTVKRETDAARRKREAAGVLDCSQPLREVADHLHDLFAAHLKKGGPYMYLNFAADLASMGIHLVPTIQLKDGKPHLQSLNYQCLDDNGNLYTLKASALGSRHTWRKLTQLGVTIDLEDEATARLIMRQLAQGAGTTALNGGETIEQVLERLPGKETPAEVAPPPTVKIPAVKPIVRRRVT